MATVTLNVGDNLHVVACRDGEEERLRTLGAMIASRWPGAQRAAGNGGNERAMLLVALMLADSLDEAENRPLPEGLADEATLARLAERLERLAETLESVPASA